MHASWTENAEPLDQQHLCSVYVCYTFWRDPVDRFLSGYHEVMKRTLTEPYASSDLGIVLRALRTMNMTKLGKFAAFLSEVEAGIVHDPHVGPQKTFVQSSNSHYPRTPSILIHDLKRSQHVVAVLLCGAYARCYGSHPPCPHGQLRSSLPLPLSLRDRHAPEYGLAEFSVEQEELDVGQLHRIITLFKEDYCFFGIAMHPQYEGTLEEMCAEGETSKS